MSTLVDVDQTTASGVLVPSPTPNATTAPGGRQLNLNFTAIVALIRSAQATIVALQTAVAALAAATPSTISGSIAESQVTGLTGHLAAKLPLTGGTLTGDVTSTGTITADTFKVNLSIGDNVTGTDIYAFNLATNILRLIGGTMLIDYTPYPYIFKLLGNYVVAMGDGSGTGGGDLLMDGGNIRTAGDVTAQTHSAVSAFWHNGTMGTTNTITWAEPNGTNHSLTIEGGIITAAS